MFEKLAALAARHAELEQLLADPEVAGDYRRVVELSKERASLSDTVADYREYQRLAEELSGARELLAESDDAEMRALAETEVASLQEQQSALFESLRLALLPKDRRDQKNVIMEIRAGAGGDEAGIFASDLYRIVHSLCREAWLAGEFAGFERDGHRRVQIGHLFHRG